MPARMISHPNSTQFGRRISRLEKKNIFLAICGLCIIVYSYTLCWCPITPTGAGDGGANMISTEEAPFTIIPNYCDSPLRGHFDKIYATGMWGQTLRKPAEFYDNADWPPILKTAASGLGSNRGVPTVTSMKILKDVIARYNVKSMIDIPCGDVNWIFDSFETDTLPIYIGLDITLGIIKANTQRFDHHKNKHFIFWDATACALPKFQHGGADEQSVDLVHVRDVIQHMSLDQGVSFFCNVFRSGAKTLIATTFEQGVNTPIAEGDYYTNNLSLEPFSFPKMDNCTATHPTIEADVTCVYDLTQDWVQEFLASKC